MFPVWDVHFPFRWFVEGGICSVIGLSFVSKGYTKDLKTIECTRFCYFFSFGGGVGWLVGWLFWA